MRSKADMFCYITINATCIHILLIKQNNISSKKVMFMYVCVMCVDV